VTEQPRRMLKKADIFTRPPLSRRDASLPRQGRSERRGESYSVSYVEPLSDARTPLVAADFFSILLEARDHFSANGWEGGIP
jgi:hypothetical protein